MNELNMRELTEEDRKRNTEVRAKLGYKLELRTQDSRKYIQAYQKQI